MSDNAIAKATTTTTGGNNDTNDDTTEGKEERVRKIDQSGNVVVEMECLCPICLDLLYKPVCNSSCGHCFCFWCNHRSMNCFGESQCPYCRAIYSTFPRVCFKLHQILSKLYPIQMSIRENEVKTEEQSNAITSPTQTIDTETPLTAEDFKCDSCNEFLYKPLVLTCGHAVCQWCFYAEEEDGSIDVLNDACPVCLLPTCTSLLVPSHLFVFLINHLKFETETNTRREKYREKEDKWEELLKDHQKKQIVRVKEEHKKFSQSPFAVVTDSTHIEGEESYSYNIAPNTNSITITTPPTQRAGGSSASIAASTNTGSTSNDSTANTPSNTSTTSTTTTTTTTAGDPVMNFTLDIEKFVHYGVGCDSCGMFPVVGRRYKCVDCPEKIGFDLCQNCKSMGIKSMKGRFNQSHKEEHKMVEVMEHTIIHTLQAMNPQLTPAEILTLLRNHFE
eukprot:TRINITY_DN11405_c0_g1_i1.p1 TRINITY_DN11405_c0_g1~~TRINITY_DN11405_c0_g1_i1.p1  ORF type:complete len:447 (-),score=78.74 TRINITY_DN11405_c0_g1_i1:91-1431(-)